MQDKLYEVILTPAHIDTFHAGLISLERMYRGLLNLHDQGDKPTLDWLAGQGLTVKNLEHVYENTMQTLYQVAHFTIGTEIPPNADPAFTLNFKEAFEPFEEL